MPSTAQFRDRHLALQKRLDGELAQSHDDFWTNELNLFFQKWLAGRDFIRFGIAVVRRSALDHIGDIDVLASNPARPGDLRRARVPLRQTSAWRADFPRRKLSGYGPSIICTYGNRQSQRVALRDYWLKAMAR